MNRRTFTKHAAGIPAALMLPQITDQKLVVTDIRIHEVKVNARGNWHFVELKTNKGLTGLGEASHGFAVKDGPGQLHAEIKHFFGLVKGESPFNIEQFRQRGLKAAAEKGKAAITAFSAIEHALWDLKGKALGVPVYDLLGGKLRDKLKVYANINPAGPFLRRQVCRSAQRSPTFQFSNMRMVKCRGVPGCCPQPSILTKVTSTFRTRRGLDMDLMSRF
ncbi:hypothetical protein LXM25_03850 [Dyadobacter sp. LJ53]|nr:hypothetical protein [Dyadobacter chenwenxiniae]MCF0049179.1 hypothetical protein [Dyadobacter chenwenxiniae]